MKFSLSLIHREGNMFQPEHFGEFINFLFIKAEKIAVALDFTLMRKIKFNPASVAQVNHHGSKVFKIKPVFRFTVAFNNGDVLVINKYFPAQKCDIRKVDKRLYQNGA